MVLGLRRAVAAVLLAFVAVSVVVLVIQEVQGGRGGTDLFEKGPSDGVLIVYFHHTARCASCRQIEESARAVVDREFRALMAEGRLAWRTVDLDAPGNRGLAREYHVAAAAVVVIEVRGGRPGRWKNLDRAWELVDDSDSLSAFFQREIEAFLKGD